MKIWNSLPRCSALLRQETTMPTLGQTWAGWKIELAWQNGTFATVLIQKAHQLLAAAGLLELADGFGFDLADAFAGDFENVANLFQRVAVAVAQAVPQLDDLALAVAQGLEHLVDPRPQHLLRGAGGRALGGAVGKE